MTNALEILRKRSKDNWLIGHDSMEFLSLTEALFEEFTKPITQKILLVESDTVSFLASFIAACSTNHQVFLGNPIWGVSEWEKVLDLVQPDRIWGNCSYFQNHQITRRSRRGPLRGAHSSPDPSHVENQCFPPLQGGIKGGKSHRSNNAIAIPTGGSSGNIRFAMHTWETLMASVEGFRAYFQLTQVNSICVLPLYHVSGLMQFMRSFTSGGRISIAPFKDLKAGKYCTFDPTEFFISLVPTQLQYLLWDTTLTNWLSQCKTVLLGGAPAWPELLAKARSDNIPVAPCYGMTETASQIATLKPEIFLMGNNSTGGVLPHAKVDILSEEGKVLGCNEIGAIAIQATSLALGYYPEMFPESEYFYTDDLGFFDSQGNLNLVGRHSDKVITGGENVFPAEVESAIRTTDLVVDVSVIGLPDPYWGQILTAVYIPRNTTISSQQIQDAIRGKIAKFKQPKLWIPVEKLPRNEQGKLNRKAVKQIAIRYIE